MIEPIKIILACSGINNKIDPKRLNESELAEGQNIDIDDTGQISSRLGQTSLSSTVSHSLFYDGVECLVAQDRTSDAALYRVNNDSLTLIHTGLIKGAYLSYVQIGAQEFYTNGTQNGVVTNAVRSAWPVDTYRGPATLKVFSPAPVGHLLCKFSNRIGVAIDEGSRSTIYFSQPYRYGLFRLAKYFFTFASHIRMAVEVAGGLWVSDSTTTGFIAKADTWDGQRFVRKSQFPAHEYSLNCRLVDLSDSQWKIPGLSAVWRSDEGLCIGTPDGQLLTPEKDKMIPPTGTNGATVVDNTIAISSTY